jgi:hypothetical protein
MAVEQEHFVHLARPLAPTAMGFTGSAPLTVNIQPQVCPPTHPPLLPPHTLLYLGSRMHPTLIKGNLHAP